MITRANPIFTNKKIIIIDFQHITNSLYKVKRSCYKAKTTYFFHNFASANQTNFMVICADCSPTELVTHEIDNKFNVTIKGYLLLYIL